MSATIRHICNQWRKDETNIARVKEGLGWWRRIREGFVDFTIFQVFPNFSNWCVNSSPDLATLAVAVSGGHSVTASHQSPPSCSPVLGEFHCQDCEDSEGVWLCVKAQWPTTILWEVNYRLLSVTASRSFPWDTAGDERRAANLTCEGECARITHDNAWLGYIAGQYIVTCTIDFAYVNSNKPLKKGINIDITRKIC